MPVMPLTPAPLAGSEDDPWKASALISALSQLLLAILFLFQTVVACLTLQVIKYFGLGNPCWYTTYLSYSSSPSQARHVPREFQENGAFRCGHFRPFSRAGASSSSEPSADSNVFNGSAVLKRGLEACLTRTVSTERGFSLRRRPKTEDESSFTGLENRGSVLGRSRSQYWCVPKMTTLVCPNCNAAWTVTRPPLFKDAKDVSQVRNHWEDGMTGNKEEVFRWQGRAASPASADAGRKGSSAKSQEENKETAGVLHELEANVGCNKEMQLPAQNFPSLAEEVVEDALNGRIDESIKHVSPFLLQDGEVTAVPNCHEQAGLDIAGNEERKPFSDIQESLSVKLASCFKEVARENSVIGMSGSGKNWDRLFEAEGDLETEGDYRSSADVIIALRKALWMEREALCALNEEFEVERNAAETAANEAIGMISRLQEEKAALQMESAHYQRMAEEKAIYDEKAMQLLKEVLYRRERENFVLEKEVKLFKRSFFREVSRATKRPKELANPSLSREPMLLLECSQEAAVSKEHHQEVSTAYLEFQGAEENCNISRGTGLGENSLAKSSFRTEIIDEQPNKRRKGFTVHADESNGFGLPCLFDSAIDLTFSTLGGVNEFEQACQDSFPQMEQLEQSEQTMGMPASAGDEDETNFILHQLMDLEEQLHALGEVDGFEPCNLVQFLENPLVSDAIVSTSFASVTKDQVIVDSFPYDVFGLLSPGRECKPVRCIEEGLGPMRDGFYNPPGMLESPDAVNFDKRSSLDINFTTSCTQPREGTQICTAHDKSEIPSREDARDSSLHCEGDVVMIQDNINPAGRTPCLSNFLRDDLTRANSGTSIEDGTQNSSLAPSSDAGHLCTSNVDSQCDIDAESLQCESHCADFISEDEKWSLKGKELQELHIRLQVLQSEGVLERHPSISLNPKDAGINLLKAVAQELQELPRANSDTADSVEVLLPAPADSGFLFTSKTDTIIRKRHFLNGPGQI